MWTVANGSLAGYSTSGGTAVLSATTVSGGQYYSVAVTGTATAQKIFLSDVGNHQLVEYTSDGSTTLTQVGTWAFASDPSGGAISPQEIAVDPAGNLWTTSFDGQIVEYNGTTGNPTTIFSAGSTLSGARGIMIVGTTGPAFTTSPYTAYVTVQGSYGSGFVDSFSAAGTANPTLSPVSTLGGSTTTGGQETGQMRGITKDTGGNIYYADNTWGASGTNNGYICEVPTGASLPTSCLYSGAFKRGLNGVNELVTGPGVGSTNNGPGCDQLYSANYYAGTVTYVNTSYRMNGTQSTSACGTAGAGGATYLSGLTNVSGLAIVPGQGAIGGDIVPGPTFIETNVASLPEPGTFGIAAALLGLGAIRKFRKSKA